MSRIPTPIVFVRNATQKIENGLPIFDRNDLIEICNNTKNEYENTANCILAILERNTAKSLRITVGTAKLDDSTIVHHVVLTGNTDFLLMKLAEKFNFPRGFHIIIINNQIYTICGFYPKFKNNSGETAEDSVADFQTLSFTKKFSGSLGGITIIDHHGILYCIAMSKNSMLNDTAEGINYPFETYLLFAKMQVSDEFIHKIATEKLTLWFEVLIPSDPHACFPPNLVGILIAVSFVAKNAAFCNYFDPAQLHEFAVIHNLNIDDVYIVDKPQMITTIATINANKNVITNAKFNEIMENANVRVIKGTVRHGDVLGDTLEGVIVIYDTGNGTRIFKWKFPRYTCITFGIREAIKQKIKNGSTFSIEDHASKYVEHWTNPGPEQDIYKKNIIEAYNSLLEKYNNTLEYCIITGDHIREMDARCDQGSALDPLRD